MNSIATYSSHGHAWRLNSGSTVAQKGQARISGVKALKNDDKALKQSGLESLALRYVSRYATTRHKLKAYLHRKVRERGWNDEKPAAINDIAEKYAKLGYIDDALFAKSRASALLRKGYGKRRVALALDQAGIDDADRADALLLTDAQIWEAAVKFAKRKSAGPYAEEQYDRAKCQKLLQAFLRAGHSFEIASKFVFAKPGENIDQYF